MMDVYKAHQTPGVRNLLEDNGFAVEFVPANCTSELQPLDVRINSTFKVDLKGQFTQWYSDKVSVALTAHPQDVNTAVSSVQPDLTLMALQPLHAKWVMNAFSRLTDKHELLGSAWRYTGITQAVAQAATCISKLPRSQEEPSAKADKPPNDKLQESPSLVTTIQAPAIAAEVEIGQSYLEYYLPKEVCQSRLGGCQGSSACCIIALVGALKIICGLLPELGQVPTAEARSVFTTCIMQGNSLYDKSGHDGLLTVQQALTATSTEVPLTITKEMFTTSSTGWHSAITELRRAALQAPSRTSAAIMVSTPYSFLLGASGGGSVVLYDSHSRGSNYSGLFAVFPDVAVQ